METALASKLPGNETQQTWTQDQLDAYLDHPLLSGNRMFRGTEGMMLRDIEQDILKGGRFIVHHWCLSIIVMTFTRTSPVYYLRSWKSGLGRASFYSLISMTFGWWGFPFGFLFTPVTLWKNGCGGTDVTAELLHQILGPGRTQSVLTKAAPRKVDVLHNLLLTVSLALPAGLIYAFIRWIAA